MKYYLDDHVAKAIAQQLVARGADAVHCADVDKTHDTDTAHLEYATAEGRVVVTQDDDFVKLAITWAQSGKDHAGVMLLPPHLNGQAQISYAVNVLFEYHELVKGGAATDDEFENTVTYL
ncbi:MAG: DUF5615 family PIN-like protein [Chloroflexota bacterium]